MKTRIVNTQIHFEDDWFNLLPNEYKYPFLYLFTNTHIGLTGVYKLSARVAITETRLPKEIWLEACQHFEEEGKVKFYKDWIYVVNAKRYAKYKGEKNEIALLKEAASIPDDVTNYFGYSIDTLSYSSDTTINHKPLTINHKSLNRAVITKLDINNNQEEVDVDEVAAGIEAERSAAKN